MGWGVVMERPKWRQHRRSCILCKEDCYSFAAHIPVCKTHYEEYVAEAEKYLLFEERHFYQSLLMLDDGRKANEREGTQ